jgi:hypothetical protein
MSLTDKLITFVLLIIIAGLIVTGIIAVAQFSTPIEDGSYTGQKIDYSHQRGIIFQTNDLTTKTNDRSSTTEDWCVPDEETQLIEEVREIDDGDSVRIDYHRPLWIWPDTCEGGLKVIDSIETVNSSS